MSTQDNMLGPRRALQVDISEGHQSRRGVCATRCARNPTLTECFGLFAEAIRAVVPLWKTRWRRADVEAT